MSRFYYILKNYFQLNILSSTYLTTKTPIESNK